MMNPPASSCCSWSWDEDKEFENAVADFPEEAPDRWELVASRVPGKAPAEVEQHYQVLVEDINAIEAGLVPLPRYDDDDQDEDEDDGDDDDVEDDVPVLSSKRKRGREGERRKGTPWTEEEHKLFLIGLQKYGKGDWRSISRNAVVTRTPTQVASHAQKYFERKAFGKKEKKRSSIHDVTVNEADILRASNQIVQVNSPSSQQQMMNHSQVSFPNHGGAALGYQNYGYPM